MVLNSATITEGQGVTLTGSVNYLGNTPVGPFALDLNGDGIFGDAIGTPGAVTNGVTAESVTLTWAQLQSFGITGTGTYQIAAQAEDAATVSGVTTDYTAQAAASVVVNHTTPTVTAGNSGTVAAGTPFAISFFATEVGTEQVSSWTVNWGDGTTSTYGADSASATHVYAAPGSDTITVGMFDGTNATYNHGNAYDAAPITATVTVAAISVSAGGPYTIAEGASLTLQATAPGTPTSYAWDINGDGVFTDAGGANPTLTWAQLQALPNKPIDDTGTFHPEVQVSYSDGEVVTSAPATLAVTETPPTATALISSVDTTSGTLTTGTPVFINTGSASPSSGFPTQVTLPTTPTYALASVGSGSTLILDTDNATIQTYFTVPGFGNIPANLLTLNGATIANGTALGRSPTASRRSTSPGTWCCRTTRWSSSPAATWDRCR